jgi:hypothetical protein
MAKGHFYRYMKRAIKNLRGLQIKTSIQLKFEMGPSSTYNLTLLSTNVKDNGSNFCGLLRKPEL